jgi:hypothetical protein
LHLEIGRQKEKTINAKRIVVWVTQNTCNPYEDVYLCDCKYSLFKVNPQVQKVKEFFKVWGKNTTNVY